MKVTPHKPEHMGALADCRRAAVKVSAQANRPSVICQGVHTQVRIARGSKRAVGSGGSADAIKRAAADITTTVKLGTPKVSQPNPKTMGVRAGCRRAAAQDSESTPKTKQQVKFMLPGEASLNRGEAFALQRVRQASCEAVPPRAASSGAVKWLSNESSGKCWVWCKHGAVCVQGFKVKTSAREKECECKPARCAQDAHLWWAVHERGCRAATVPPEEAEGSVMDCSHGGVTVGDRTLKHLEGGEAAALVGGEVQQCKASTDAWWAQHHRECMHTSLDGEEHKLQAMETEAEQSGACPWLWRSRQLTSKGDPKLARRP